MVKVRCNKNKTLKIFHVVLVLNLKVEEKT